MRAIDLVIPLGDGLPASLTPYTEALKAEGFMLRRLRVVRRADDAAHYLAAETMLGVLSGERGHVRRLAQILKVDKIFARPVGVLRPRQFTQDCGDEIDGDTAPWFISVSEIAALGGFSPVTVLPGFIKPEQQQL